MISNERCPVIQCDFFQHKQKKKAYRVIQKEKKRDLLAERLASMEEKLTEISRRLIYKDFD
ncbi:MAG: hypothetical protein FWE32_12440 [Oscillospiraceae bacterium]|nr:hypothetical protein [Oscillospiraceae bacterium]